MRRQQTLNRHKTMQQILTQTINKLTKFKQTGFVQKIATIFPGLFNDYSRTKYNFQGPPTRNVILQIVYKYTFPVQANRFLRLQVFSPSPSLQFSVHFFFYSLLAPFTPMLYSI